MRRPLVENNPHLNRRGAPGCVIQNRSDLSFGHAGKPFEKVGYGRAIFEIFE